MTQNVQTPRIRTTVSLAADLLHQVDAAVQAGLAGSRNEFLALSLRNQLAAQRREQIDAAFADMAQDRSHRREALQIEDEFHATDAQAWRLADGEP
jgi:metal-responsive CopG/Arc/MetJ family transcriptional regulator